MIRVNYASKNIMKWKGIDDLLYVIYKGIITHIQGMWASSK